MWIPIQLNENSAEPLYYQIESQLRSLIISEQIEEGTFCHRFGSWRVNLNAAL
ncbi:transcriptional regulator [Paenibacillus pini JCM 16418]|uniref:Transcriptional regulator n=1 Tax=Paenibacillus pini JCM 16418 TaxID=1236976 RepID=W7YLR7_9BACL|nr:transcriptional regulator [Paenibacillus pini JCM 16418]